MRKLKNYCPYGRTYRKKFLASVEGEVDTYIQGHVPCSYEMLEAELGKPQEVISNYLKEIAIIDIQNIRTEMIKYVIATISVCFLLFGAFMVMDSNRETRLNDGDKKDMTTAAVEDNASGYSEVEEALFSHPGNYYDEEGNVVLKVIAPIAGNGDFVSYILDTDTLD